MVPVALHHIPYIVCTGIGLCGNGRFKRASFRSGIRGGNGVVHSAVIRTARFDQLQGRAVVDQARLCLGRGSGSGLHLGDRHDCRSGYRFVIRRGNLVVDRLRAVDDVRYGRAAFQRAVVRSLAIGNGIAFGRIRHAHSNPVAFAVIGNVHVGGGYRHHLAVDLPGGHSIAGVVPLSGHGNGVYTHICGSQTGVVDRIIRSGAQFGATQHDGGHSHALLCFVVALLGGVQRNGSVRNRLPGNRQGIGRGCRLIPLGFGCARCYGRGPRAQNIHLAAGVHRSHGAAFCNGIADLSVAVGFSLNREVRVAEGFRHAGFIECHRLGQLVDHSHLDLQALRRLIIGIFRNGHRHSDVAGGIPGGQYAVFDRAAQSVLAGNHKCGVTRCRALIDIGRQVDCIAIQNHLDGLRGSHLCRVRSLVDGEGRAAVDGVITARIIGDGHGCIARVRIFGIANRVFGVGNDSFPILDRYLRGLLMSVIGEGRFGEGYRRFVYGLGIDPCLHPGGVTVGVVAVADDFVPDIIGAGIGCLGYDIRILAVGWSSVLGRHGIVQGTILGRARLDERLTLIRSVCQSGRCGRSGSDCCNRLVDLQSR